jgi:hypothetical protein
VTAPVGDPSQPTIYEMIRTVSAKMDEQARATARLEGTVHGMVTHDQLRAVNELLTHRIADVGAEADRGNERITWWSRASMVGLGFPVLVGAILWISNGAVLTMPTT